MRDPLLRVLLQADSLTGGGNLSLDMETDLPVGPAPPLPFNVIPEDSLSMTPFSSGLVKGLSG